MRARLLPALAALLAATAASLGYPPVPPARPAKEKPLDAKALEGTWTVVKYESGNAWATQITPLYKSVVIKGNTWTQVRAAKGPGPSYTFTLDTTKSPARIDMTIDTFKGQNFGARRGVLELQGAQLTVSYGMVSEDVPRPDKPGAKLTGAQFRWVLKRDRP
jgi:uncharacterized protein (TIGR03067 family)